MNAALLNGRFFGCYYRPISSLPKRFLAGE